MVTHVRIWQREAPIDPDSHGCPFQPDCVKTPQVLFTFPPPDRKPPLSRSLFTAANARNHVNQVQGRIYSVG